MCICFALGVSQFSDGFLLITEIVQETKKVRLYMTLGPLAVRILPM
jgi:hypothetical protein